MGDAVARVSERCAEGGQRSAVRLLGLSGKPYLGSSFHRGGGEWAEYEGRGGREEAEEEEAD